MQLYAASYKLENLAQYLTNTLPGIDHNRICAEKLFIRSL
jgi:hypothetical protein